VKLTKLLTMTLKTETATAHCCTYRMHSSSMSRLNSNVATLTMQNNQHTLVTVINAILKHDTNVEP